MAAYLKGIEGSPGAPTADQYNPHGRAYPDVSAFMVTSLSLPPPPRSLPSSSSPLPFWRRRYLVYPLVTIATHCTASGRRPAVLRWALPSIHLWWHLRFHAYDGRHPLSDQRCPPLERPSLAWLRRAAHMEGGAGASWGGICRPRDAEQHQLRLRSVPIRLFT